MIDYIHIEPKNGKRNRSSNTLFPELDDKSVNQSGGINYYFNFIIVEDVVCTKDQFTQSELEDPAIVYYDEINNIYYKVANTFYVDTTYRIIVIDKGRSGSIPKLFFNVEDSNIAVIISNNLIKFRNNGVVDIIVCADLENTGDFTVLDDLTKQVIIVNGNGYVITQKNNEI